MVVKFIITYGNHRILGRWLQVPNLYKLAGAPLVGARSKAGTRTMKYSGSCLCKKVTFELEGHLSGFFLCHCSRCRKATGSAHGANLFSKTATFRWVSGKEHAKTFRLEGTRFARTFCDVCGSALPTVEENVRIVVPAGSVDCDVDRRPDAHIFMSSKANWDKDFEQVAKFEGLPR